MDKEKLILSISKTLQDYRKNEINKIDYNHVNRWINQFDSQKQIVILQEVNHILKKFYLSKNKVKEIIKEVLSHEDIIGNDINKELSNMNFLDIQTKGNSQKDLLVLVDEILKETFKLNLNECGGGNTYFYIDDAVFTGNRLRYDVVPWIEKNNIGNNSRLIIFTIGMHKKGFEYASKYIDKISKRKNLKVEYWRLIEINNERRINSSIEILWPMEVIGDPNVDNYCNHVRKTCEENGWRYNIFRTHKVPNESLFTCSENRQIVEEEFLTLGAKLYMAAQSPSKSMRPLGFEKLESLGFGTFFCTYRNISNNCPLVLWYGDADNHIPPHPLSLWYPLLPRKVNETIIEEFNIDWGKIIF